MTGRCILVFALAILSGCAGTPPAVERVEIPVFTPCVKVVPVRPDFEFDKLSSTASDGEKVLALARDWPRGRKYEAQLEAVVAGCAGSASS
jgi:hypothetical protein